MIKKYTLASLENYSAILMGKKVMRVYLEVEIWFDDFKACGEL